jgi:hypothetical protein
MIYRLPLPPDARSEAAFLYHNVTAFSTKIDFAQNPWVFFAQGKGLAPPVLGLPGPAGGGGI